jgi:hypothetical protein
MARKKARHSSENRWGKVSAEEIRASSARLKGLAAELESVAAVMEAEEIENVNIDGATKVDRACEMVIQYIGKLSNGVATARLS